MAIHVSESLKMGLADILMRKVRSVVTVVGIVLGVMCIMVVLAIVNGMNNTTMEWMKQRGGLAKIEVHQNWNYDFNKGGEASFSLRELNYMQEQLPEAKAFNPQVNDWEAVLQFKDTRYRAQVVGVMPDMTIAEDWQADKGRFIKDLDVNESGNVIVLGSSVATELFGSRNPLGQKVVYGSQQMTVIGIMSRKYIQGKGGAFGDNPLEYMNRRSMIPLSTMLNKIKPGTKINQVDIIARSPEAAIPLRSKIENIVLNLKAGKRVFEVASAQEQMQEMKQSSMIFSAIFVLIGVISLLVGGIVIMNIMLASVKERTREIGVRLAVGARGVDIFFQFLVQTVLITALGGVLGILLGYAILGQVGKFLDLSVMASPQMIAAALTVSVGVGLIFGIFPAVRASGLDPVIALREE